MKREVCLVKLLNDKLCLIPVEEFFECEDYRSEPSVCKIITDKHFGWWIYENTYIGCASDGIGDEVKVRDITEDDINLILKNDGKCFVEVDYKNKLSVPKNYYGEGKIVIYFN